MRDDVAVERRLEREATTHFMGTLGNRDGVNVAKVQVSWYTEDPGLGFVTELCESAGYFLVHATGDPSITGEPDIYGEFEELVGEAMEKRVRDGRCDGWQIDDVSAA